MEINKNPSDRKTYFPGVSANTVFGGKLYPVEIKVFDSENQLTDTFRIQGFHQFFNFIDALPDETNAVIVYPVLVSDPKGNFTVLRSNAQLETFIAFTINRNTKHLN